MKEGRREGGGRKGMGGGDEGALRVKIWSIVLPVHGINAGGGGGDTK